MKRHNVVVIWFIFWTISYFILLGIFASSSEWQKIDYIYTAIFLVTLMIPVAVNEFILLPRLLFQRSYFLWLAAVDVLIWISIWFNELLFGKLIDFILPDYYFISYYEFIDLFKFFGAFVGLTTLMSLSLEWFKLQKEETTAATGRLNNLINQVNPHFLFNSLTVLYTLSLKDNRATSAAIIKLSDILRYVIYKSPNDTVKLSSEAAILRDYIDLQRYRVHPTTRIDFTDNIKGDVSVAPMLFLPLVENAFKHGVHGETENAFVHISLLEDKGVVNFKIRNNKSNTGTTPGIGLKNLKERLDLLYPGKHSFVIAETENEFNVEMHLHGS